MARVSKKSLTLTVLFTYYMVGLKPEEKTKKEKQKENNIHGH